MTHTVKHVAASCHAVLSHHPPQGLQDLLPAYPAALDQPGDHPKVGNHLRVKPLRAHGGKGRRLSYDRLRRGLRQGRRTAPPLVQGFLLDLACLGAVVGRTALRGSSRAVPLSASEGTAQIVTSRVPGVGEEEDVAVLASLQIPPEAGVCPNDRAKNTVVRPGETSSLPLSVPLCSEFEAPLELYCKKARASLMIGLSFLCIPLSYPLDTAVSIGRTGAFFTHAVASSLRPNRPSPSTLPPAPRQRWASTS